MIVVLHAASGDGRRRARSECRQMARRRSARTRALRFDVLEKVREQSARVRAKCFDAGARVGANDGLQALELRGGVLVHGGNVEADFGGGSRRSLRRDFRGFARRDRRLGACFSLAVVALARFRAAATFVADFGSSKSNAYASRSPLFVFAADAFPPSTTAPRPPSFTATAFPRFSLFSSSLSSSPTVPRAPVSSAARVRHTTVVSVPNLITLPSLSVTPSPPSSTSSPSTSVPFDDPASEIVHASRLAHHRTVACDCDTAPSPLIHTAFPRFVRPIALSPSRASSNARPAHGPVITSSVIAVAAVVPGRRAARRGGIRPRRHQPSSARRGPFAPSTSTASRRARAADASRILRRRARDVTRRARSTASRSAANLESRSIRLVPPSTSNRHSSTPRVARATRRAVARARRGASRRPASR